MRRAFFSEAELFTGVVAAGGRWWPGVSFCILCTEEICEALKEFKDIGVPGAG